MNSKPSDFSNNIDSPFGKNLTLNLVSPTFSNNDRNNSPSESRDIVAMPSAKYRIRLEELAVIDEKDKVLEQEHQVATVQTEIDEPIKDVSIIVLPPKTFRLEGSSKFSNAFGEQKMSKIFNHFITRIK